MNISVRTVENHYRNIYPKLGITKAIELSRDFFISVFKLDFDMTPLKRCAYGTVLLMAMMPSIINNNLEGVRRAGKGRNVVIRISKRQEDGQDQ